MPSGMTRKEVDRWKARLAHAHRLWSAVGMTADRIGSRQALGERGEPIWQGLRQYRLDAWSGAWGGIAKRNLATTTLGFSAYNTWSAGLLVRNPRAQVLPRLRNASQKATDVAKDALLVEALLNLDIETANHRRELNRALFTSFFSPFGGCLRHGFTPSAEFYADDRGEVRAERLAFAEPDRPWIEAVKSWNVRVDPVAERFDPDHSARWVAFRKLRTLEEVRRNPNLVSRRDLKPNIVLGTSGGPRRESELRGYPDDEWFESWVFYENETRTWFELADGLEKPLREPADWPIPWKDLPYDRLAWNEQEDTAFQFPYMAAIEKTLRERNKLRTIQAELVKRLRRLIFVNAQRLAEGEAAKLTGDELDLAEFIFTGQSYDPNTVALQMQVGGLDTTLAIYDAQLVTDIREALGQSQMDRASRINVETAQEAMQVQQGSDVAHARNSTTFDAFLSSYIRHYAIARQAVTEVPELIPLFGVEDTRVLQDHLGSDYLTVTPKQLRGEYSFQVQAGSTARRDRQQEVALAIGDLQLTNTIPEMKNAVNQNQLYLNWALARGLSPTTVLLTDAQRMRVAGMGQPQLPGQEAPEQPAPPQLDQMMRVILENTNRGGTPQ